MVRLPDSNEDIGRFLEDIKRAGYRKPLRVALSVLSLKYKETEDKKYLDTFNRLMLVKRLILCYNYYRKKKSKHRAKLFHSILKEFGVV